MQGRSPSLFPALSAADWWPSFIARREARAVGDDLPVALAAAGHADPATALAHCLLAHPSVLSRYAAAQVPPGLEALLRTELWRLSELVRRVQYPERPAPWSAAGREGAAGAAPPGAGGGASGAPAVGGLAFSELDEAAAARVARLAAALLSADADGVTAAFLELLKQVGNGPGALYPALSWRSGKLEPVLHPDLPAWDALVGLDGPLERLAQNTEALLAGAPGNDCLLYGARGSGKSTAVRSLLGRYAGEGLRLVEVPLTALHELPELLEELRPQPLKYVLFMDDLTFGDEDPLYRPLKSLLEGGVRLRPTNVVVYATSNRRHLVRERLRDRPDPLDDDVHAWDTHHERLALADRFGLVITFPAADQRRYLEVVRALAKRRGLPLDAALDERALRFAEWNNGYSGRTARQFVDTEAAPPGASGS